jgi:hypothetical protein
MKKGQKDQHFFLKKKRKKKRPTMIYKIIHTNLKMEQNQTQTLQKINKNMKKSLASSVSLTMVYNI